jgi:hypothetical protein
MASADVSIRLSVQDADKVSAAFDKIGADGQALQQKLAAANQQLAASSASMNGQLDHLKSGNEKVAGSYLEVISKAHELSGGMAETAEHVLNMVNHLKLLAVAAYAVSPAFRSIVGFGVSKAFGEIPTVASLAAQAIGKVAPYLSFFSRIAIPIGGAVAAFEGLNYVIGQGADLMKKYGGYERSLFGDDTDSNLEKLTKLQGNDNVTLPQQQYAAELANRLAAAKQEMSSLVDVQLNLTDASLKFQAVWVSVAEAAGKAAGWINGVSISMADIGNMSVFKWLASAGHALGNWQLPGTIPVAPPGTVAPPSQDAAQAMAIARGRLAAGMGGGFTGRFTQDIDALQNPPTPKKTEVNDYDREIQKIKEEIAELNLESEGLGKTSRALEEMKIAHEASTEAVKAGIPVTSKMRAQWKQYGDEIADVNMKIKQTKASQEENFKAQTMFLPPDQAAAANVAHGIDPNDWKSHLDDAAAKQAAVNTDLEQVHGVISQISNDLGSTLVTVMDGVHKGSDAWRQFGQEAVRSIQNIIVQMMILKPLEAGIGSLFGGMFGGPTNLGTTGGTGGGLGGLFADGGIMTSRGPLRLNRYASGGVARGAQMAIFGEGSGPEAYVPLPDGRAIPVNINSRGGGNANVSSVVNVHMNIPQGTSVEDAHRMSATAARQMRDVVNQAVDDRIITHLRTGGLLNAA